MGRGGGAHVDSRYLHIHHLDANPEASPGHTALLHLETTVRTITIQLSSLQSVGDRQDPHRTFFFSAAEISGHALSGARSCKVSLVPWSLAFVLGRDWVYAVLSLPLSE